MALAQPKYGTKTYHHGLNSRGLKSRKDEDPQLPTTERGKRRKTKPKHVHEWVARRFEKGSSDTSYHEARIQNEMRFWVSQHSTKPNSGGVVQGGSPHKKGCGCPCKAPRSERTTKKGHFAPYIVWRTNMGYKKKIL